MIGIKSSNVETTIRIIDDYGLTNLNLDEERLVKVRMTLKKKRDGEGSGVDREDDHRCDVKSRRCGLCERESRNDVSLSSSSSS